MDALAKGILSGLLAVCAIILLPTIGTCFGAFAGWAVGLFFAETILGFLSRTGIDVSGLAMWELGAALGFIGGFLKTSVSTSAGQAR